jgi:8-oxo-dGTP pyrophosphatase MutT (NUDIX family)
VAIHVGPSLLLRSSYRRARNFPGGSVRQGDTPKAAARSELAEEIGSMPDMPVRSAGEVRGVWDGRRDHVWRPHAVPEFRTLNARTNPEDFSRLCVVYLLLTFEE